MAAIHIFTMFQIMVVKKEEYNNMLKNIDYSLLPEGIKFEFK